MEDKLVRFGGAIKAIGDDGTIGGYLVRFTDENRVDSEEDFFNAKTDYDMKNGDRVTVYYAHGLDPKMKNKRLGAEKGTMRTDEVGIWVQTQLDLRDKWEAAIHKMVKANKLGWSSGSLPHLVEKVQIKEGANWIKSWPLGGDASITPTPAAGPELTAIAPLKSFTFSALQADGQEDPGDGSTADAGAELDNGKVTKQEKEKTMTPEEVAEMVAQAIRENDEENAAKAEAATVQADREANIAQAAFEKGREEAAKNDTPSNDPGLSAPYVAKFADAWKYDNHEAGDLAATLEMVGNARNKTNVEERASNEQRPEMVKALALRLESDEAKDTDTRQIAGKQIQIAGPLQVASNYMKGMGIKANETNFTTNANYGDEWIGVAYGGQLWQSVRENSPILSQLPQFEFPSGAESMVIPVESTDPIWYLVAQAGDPSSATSGFTLTVPAKALGTANKTMTLSKLGTSVLYTGEMVEDAVLNYVAQLRVQLGVSGSEYLTSAVIDGDTETGATTSINSIGGTPNSTDFYLAFNGFRKSPLITTTANSRDGGAITSADFLETVKLMGPAGKAGFDKAKVSFILDPHVHWKVLELADLKTQDVFKEATIEKGVVERIWGYPVIASYQFAFPSVANTGYEYKTNSAGKIDLTTPSNNTLGSFLAVRWDHWRMGHRRRMTTEVERVPRADGWEITALMRAGLQQRDTEASAISYNLTV